MNNELFLLVGTYTKKSSRGIYVYRFDIETGNSEFNSLIEIENPSYLTISKNRKFVYAVSENENSPGYANAFSWNCDKGILTFLNRQITMGECPCNIITDNENNHLITSNYGGGSITLFELNEDGRIYPLSQLVEFERCGSIPDKQEGSHIHCTKLSPDNKFIFVTDLGTDRIYRFRIDNENKEEYIIQNSFKSVKVPDGSDPRHIIFHPSGKYLYLINEISGTIICFNYYNGELQEFQTTESNIMDSEKSGDIVITPDGNFLYTSNRNRGDGVTIFSIDRIDGKLTRVSYQFTGINPRNMEITPNGKFILVACHESNTIEIFGINPNSGLLEKTDKTIEIDSPVCLEFI